MADPLLCFHTQHGDRFFQGFTSIIDPGQDVAVKINNAIHNYLPALLTPFFLETACFLEADF